MSRGGTVCLLFCQKQEKKWKWNEKNVNSKFTDLCKNRKTVELWIESIGEWKCTYWLILRVLIRNNGHVVWECKQLMCGWVSESNKPRTFTQETAARVKPKVNGEFFQLTWRNVTFKYLFSLKPWFIPKSSRVILEPKPNKVLPLKPYNTVMLK